MTTFPTTRTCYLAWFAAGGVTALVVAALSTRRGRHGVGDKMIDLGIWLQTDEGVRLVERSLRAWGGEARRKRERGRHEQEQLQGPGGCGRQNGRGRPLDSDRPWRRVLDLRMSRGGGCARRVPDGAVERADIAATDHHGPTLAEAWTWARGRRATLLSP